MGNEITLGNMHLEEGTNNNIDTFIWLYDASNPYWEWLWQSEYEARAQLTLWSQKPNSEVSINRIICLSDSKQIYGGFIALSGYELKKCRKADFITLLNYAKRNPIKAMVTRIQIASKLFNVVLDDEYYLSRIGVHSIARGKGFGKRLLKAYIEEGISKGFKKFRLDVATENTQAIRLYEGFGFTIDCISKEDGVPFQYCSMVFKL